MKALLLFWMLLLVSISTTAYSQGISPKPTLEIVDLDTLEVSLTSEKRTYKPSRKITSTIHHLRLDLEPVFLERKIYGKAQLTMKAHYYPIKEIILDARGMDFKQVAIQESKENKTLAYNYDSLILVIELDREYNRNEEILLYIEYVANPYELEKRKAMPSSGRGVFFINPENVNPYKPTQVWTQNQAESASCWFPTIDAPNVRFTQEMHLTVPDNFVTLSNGLFQSSKANPNRTRTDYWKQDLTHPSYLSMFAVGEFEIAKDSWKELDVNYYTEKGFEPWVKQVFQNTPYIMEFFTNKLQFEYPWEKYHQVVVRDFTAGAMENTTASVFYESLLLDGVNVKEKNFDAIIAHELFHHWFGDLVTCESWANLSLNEAMATYGEYLWHQKHYGQDYADYFLFLDKQKYLNETQYKVEPIINFYYEDSEDLFDAHRYEKGGWVLHMLRTYFGDDLFFDALAYYLDKYKFGSVEIHELRLAFEKLSGEDLNWFFNQWFLTEGHPILEIEQAFNKNKGVVTIHISQVQDFSEQPLFTFPLQVNLYTEVGLITEYIWVEKERSTYEIPVKKQPLAIVYNENNGLLCEKTESKSPQEFVAQLKHSKGLISKLEAIESLISSNGVVSKLALIEQLKGGQWFVKKYILDKIKVDADSSFNQFIIKIALSDENVQVRSSAIDYLVDVSIDLYDVARSVLAKDSSYTMIAKALDIIAQVNYKEVLYYAENLEIKLNNPINRVLASVYAEKGDAKYFENFKIIIWNTWFRMLNPIMKSYTQYLVKVDIATFEEGLLFLEEIYKHERESRYRNRILSTIRDIEDMLIDYSDAESFAQKIVLINNLKSRI